jgi:hypothetical protein
MLLRYSRLILFIIVLKFGVSHTKEYLTEVKSIRYSLTESDKRMIKKDCSAGERSDIYSIVARYSACVYAMVIMNYEDTNTDDY